jgi:hypothetical protein
MATAFLLAPVEYGHGNYPSWCPPSGAKAEAGAPFHHIS